jgi:hypothetical protein
MRVPFRATHRAVQWVGTGGSPVLGHPQHKSADQGAAQVADAAEHRSRERLDAEQEAHVELRRLDLQHVEEGRDTGHQAADEEGHLDGARRVDTHHGGSLGVLCCGSDAHAEFGATHELVDDDHHRDCRDDDQDVDARDGHSRDVPAWRLDDASDAVVDACFADVVG